MLMVSKIWPSSNGQHHLWLGKRFLAWENQHWAAQWMDINKKTEKPSTWKRGQSMNEQSVNEDTQTPVSPGELTRILSLSMTWHQVHLTQVLLTYSDHQIIMFTNLPIFQAWPGDSSPIHKLKRFSKIRSQVTFLFQLKTIHLIPSLRSRW